MAITRHKNKDGSTSYQVRVHVTGVGKVYAGTYRTLVAARQREAEAKTTLAAFTPSESVLLRDFVPVWLERVNVEPRTLAHYDCAMKRVMPILGGVALGHIRTEDLQGCADIIAGRYTVGTARTTMQVVHNALNAARRWGYLRSTPQDRLHFPKERGERVRVFTQSQAAGIINGTDGPLHLFALLGFSTGLRMGELLGLEWEDITSSGVRVERQLHADGTVGPPKSPSAYRTVPLDGSTAQAVEAHRSTGRVITWHRMTIYKKWSKVTSLPPHAMRHTFASVIIRGGVDIKTAQRLLGHESASTTLDKYAHFIPGNEGTAAAQVTDWLTRKNEGTSG